MPSLQESTNADTSGYEPVLTAPVTSLTGFAQTSQAAPGQSVYMRTPIPPIWHASSDSLRTYFNGGVVPQNRIIPPTPPNNLVQSVTNVTNTTKVTNITNTDPTAGFSQGSNANGFWEKDPLGIITQWGAVTTDINAGTIAVTFPIPFPSTIEMILVTTWSPTDRITFVVKGSESITGFTISNNGSSGFAYWEAKGR